eukprot:CAMPEP_0174931548 /NCGR_PEP_ID=MMETSP1355-20121228/34084_1 /TAXON_ID=464990 /ORGANISM="Hemiselmis tepida, Strain CCMP443" /LENGTH=223 /DNA_ID=CAMNT_0016177909 /DNA_START=9 /DNA_END=676 /DNA_ORIENTATION=-
MAGRRQLALWALLALLCAASVTHASDMDDDELEEHEMGEAPPPAKAAGGPPLTGTIEGAIINDAFLKLTRDIRMRVLVDDGEYQGIIRADGSFAVHDIPLGTHFVTVDAVGWHFESVRVEALLRKSGKSVRMKAFTNNPAVLSMGLPYPLKLTPATRVSYFVEREKFNPMVYLKNPMVLIFGVTMIMAVVMPRMVDNMDDSDKQKLRESYKSGPASALTGGGG